MFQFRYIASLILLAYGARGEDRKLLLANVIHRHGDRSPIKCYANDPHKNEWPQGFGQLSKIGMQQAFKLGQILKSRYKSLSLINSDVYNVSEVLVASSDLDRTLMSAYCVLAGLYPPTDAEEWNPDIKWQPVPVRSIPAADDNRIAMKAECAERDRLDNALANSAPSQQLAANNEDFFAFLSQSNVTGQTNNLSTIGSLADTLFCEKAHNMLLPNWTRLEWTDKQIVYDKLMFLHEQGRVVTENLTDITSALYPLKIGPLLQEMVTNMQKKIDNKITQNLFIYSGHDSTVIAFLTLLGVKVHSNPTYSSAVLLELYQQNDKYFVSLRYRNNTFDENIVELSIPVCPSSCSWEDFVSATKSLYPVNWHDACNPPKFSQKEILIIGVAVVVVLAIIIFFVVWLVKRRRLAHSGYEYRIVNSD